MSRPTVISTFAGCGGSSLGYQMAGFEELLAVEWDDHAVQTFRLNFPGVPVFHGDIAKLSVDKCLDLAGDIKPGELDVLDGSPPCQGFSTAGKRLMVDSRNQLFREFCRLLQGLQPQAFVMENVAGMVKGKMRLIFVEILRELQACGYQVKARVLNAMYYGVPQSRQRIIFIGMRKDMSIIPTHPTGETRPIGLRQAIGLRRGWGHRCGGLREGIKNKQFKNQWRSLDLPCVTLEKTRPPILLENGAERELTLDECCKIGTFPEDWKWGAQAYHQIGNSVPPNFMRAIAEHVKGLLDGDGRTFAEVKAERLSGEDVPQAQAAG